MRTTLGEIVSRLRHALKAARPDAFLTDRMIYSVVSKHARWLLRREDGVNKVMRFSPIFQVLEPVELVEIDRVEAGCTGLSTGITFRRTRKKLPLFWHGYWGPLIRAITSLDGSQEVQPTTPAQYHAISRSKNFRFNKTLYYWYLGDYLYFPNLQWDALRIEAAFEEDITPHLCDCVPCVARQDQPLNIPDYLQGEVEAAALKELMTAYGLPSDPLPNDNQHPLR